MDEIRCPMCGKDNPADAENCQHCSARLTPLEIPGSNNIQKPAEDNNGDWLDKLRTDTTSEPFSLPDDEEPESEEQESATSEDEVPEWLSRIRLRNDFESQSSNEEQASGEEEEANTFSSSSEEVRKWLAGFKDGNDSGILGKESFGDESADIEQGSEEPPKQEDFISEEKDVLAETPATPMYFPEEKSPESENMDAFSSESEKEDNLPETPAAFRGFTDNLEIPDWLKTESDKQDEPIKDFFDEQVQKPEEAPAAQPFDEEPEKESEVPFKAFRSFPDDIEDEELETPESITAFTIKPEESPEQPETAETAPENQEEESELGKPFLSIFDEPQEIAGIISDMDAISAQEPEIPGKAFKSFPDDEDEEIEIPESFKAILEEQGEAEEIPETFFPTTQDQADTGDALPESGINLSSTEGQTGEGESGPDTGITNPWEEDIKEPEKSPDLTEADEEPMPPTVQAFTGDDLPDWIGEFSESEEPSVKAALPGFNEDQISIEDIPEWLAGINKKKMEDLDKPFTPAFSLDDISAEDQAEGVPEESTGQDAFILPGEGAFKGMSVEPEADSETIEQGSLPDWMRSLKPVGENPQDMAQASEDLALEDEGPLAGIRGILPAESIATQYQKLPVYSNQVEITEKQKIYSSLLEKSLSPKAEMAAKPRTMAEKIIPILLGLAIIVILLLALLFGGSSNAQTIESNDYPAYAADFYNQVNDLPVNSTVLLAFDFEPGYSGELKPASLAVLKHLINKDANIVILSTLPSGAIIAEEMVLASLQSASGLESQSARDTYYDQKIQNLGYLAGGTVALKQFALDPAEAAPYSLTTPIDGSQPWNQSILKDIEQIDDFFAMLIITDKLESSRAWIEQVQSGLDETPFLFISSAQILPLLQPYYQSGQIDGLLGGIQGAVMYEQTSGQAAAGLAYSGAYRIGLLILIICILAGILTQIVFKLLHIKKNDGETST